MIVYSILNIIIIGLYDPKWCHENFLSHASLKLADDVKAQLRRSMEIQGIPILQCDDNNNEEYHVKIRKATCEGFFMQIALLLPNGYYKILKDSQYVRIHPSSSMSFGNKPSLILYHEIIMSNQSYIRTCTPIQQQWLDNIALPYYVANSFTHMLR